MLDLVTLSTKDVEQHRPPAVAGDEGEVLGVVAAYALRVGSLRGDWRSTFIEEAAETAFVRPRTSRQRLSR